MRLLFWVTALAVLSIASAKNSTAKTKPKRQLESIITPHNLQYSLVLPHSRVTQFRSLTSERRISLPPRGGNLPPYAVQMEPVVQYSQKDPLYDPTLDNFDDTLVSDNNIFAQPKILNLQDQASEGTYGPPYGALPTAPLYSQEHHHHPHQEQHHHQHQEQHHHPHYYEAPEPIIEIIIKESNETLPAPPLPPVQKKKKEPVHVFYVKYSKDPHHKDKVVYDKPIPAITPPTNDEEDDHHQDYVTVTPEPIYLPQQTTTLRAIIKPESEQYHSDSSVKVTFGNEGRHYSDRRESNTEDHEETAPRPAIAHPQQPPTRPQQSPVRPQQSPTRPQQPPTHPQQPPTHPPIERSASASSKSQDSRHQEPSRPAPNHPPQQTYRPVSQHAQSRIQFQPPFLINEQQLPRQGPSVSPFRVPISRQTPFGPSLLNPHPTFSSGLYSVPTISGPGGTVFPTAFPRPSIVPSFHPRPSNPPPFGPRPQFNGPPRPSFHAGPQRPFHQPQPQQFFDEAKYLQDNYHTITTEQVEPPKEQLLPGRPQQAFHHVPRPIPSPNPSLYKEHHSQPQFIPLNQQLPQQRPPQQFTDFLNKPAFPITPSRSPFFNLKPLPPQIEDNRPPFHQSQPQQQQFSFHQGAQTLSRPSVQIPAQQNVHSQNLFPGQFSPSPSPIPESQFLPQPSAPTIFNYNPQPSPTPEQHFQQNFAQPHSPSERPQFSQPHNSPSERPQFQQSPSERPAYHQSNFQDQAQHQQNVGQFVPDGGQLVPAIPKYEQHITVSGPTARPNYSGLSEPSQPSPTASQTEQQYQQQFYDPEQEQVRLQLAQNVQKQQEEIQRLQSQLIIAQQQHHQQQQHQQQQQHHQQQQHQQEQQQQQHQQQQQQQQQQQHQQLQQQQYEQNYQQARNNYQQQQVQSTTPNSQYSQRPSYVSSTALPPYHSHYQSTARTVEIKPTTQKYVSSTINSINAPEAKKEEKNKKPAVELPDEVPDDLRQQLLSSGILDNADISILDYDKVGDTPLDSLPPDQLANFFSAGGGQQLAASEQRPIVVAPNGARIQSRIDEEESEVDQEIAASENVPSYVAPPPSHNQAVEMKVVHFDPKTAEGKKIAEAYVKEDATQVNPVMLNDKKYNRYLPLKVSGNQFPLPDILKGRKVTSVVVLAPVETEALNSKHARAERAAGDSLKGIKFIAGDSLQALLKRPTKDNFQKWLEIEKKTATDLQSVVLLVTGNEEPSAEREIYMYDISSGNVNKLSGELSNAFVDAAENNALSKDIEKLAIEGDGTPEKFNKESEDNAEASDNVPLLVDLSGVSLDQENSNQVSITSGYSKTKTGRSIRRL